MTPEPLKGKEVDCIGGRNGFLAEDIKSAVEGFVEDLQAFLDKKLEQKTEEIKPETNMEAISYLRGQVNVLDIMKEVIEEKKKKWFEDFKEDK